MFQRVINQIEQFFNISSFDVVLEIYMVATEEADIVDTVIVEKLFVLALDID